MRKTLAASALGAVIVLGGPQLPAHAETTSPSPAPTSTATVTQTEQTTKTVTEHDKTGLWGLAGLLGLAGLIPRKRHEEHHVAPVRAEHVRTQPVHTENRRVDDVRTTGTTGTTNVHTTGTTSLATDQVQGNAVRDDLNRGYDNTRREV